MRDLRKIVIPRGSEGKRREGKVRPAGEGNRRIGYCATSGSRKKASVAVGQTVCEGCQDRIRDGVAFAHLLEDSPKDEAGFLKFF